MAIYELRTYSAIVGKMSELVGLYKNEGWPVLSKHPPKLVGYFTGDVGALNQLIHTAAIEVARTHPKACVLALHPGTVDTRLTAPPAQGPAPLPTARPTCSGPTWGGGWTRRRARCCSSVNSGTM